MTDWLVKRFVKEYEETGNNVVRTRYRLFCEVFRLWQMHLTTCQMRDLLS